MLSKIDKFKLHYLYFDTGILTNINEEIDSKFKKLTGTSFKSIDFKRIYNLVNEENMIFIDLDRNLALLRESKDYKTFYLTLYDITSELLMRYRENDTRVIYAGKMAQLYILYCIAFEYKFDQSKENILDISDRNKVLKDRNKKLSNNNSRLSEVNKRLNHDVEELKKQKEELKKEVGLFKSIQDLEDRYKKLRKRNLELFKENKELSKDTILKKKEYKLLEDLISTQYKIVPLDKGDYPINISATKEELKAEAERDLRRSGTKKLPIDSYTIAEAFSKALNELD